MWSLVLFRQLNSAIIYSMLLIIMSYLRSDHYVRLQACSQ